MRRVARSRDEKCSWRSRNINAGAAQERRAQRMVDGTSRHARARLLETGDLFDGARATKNAARPSRIINTGGGARTARAADGPTAHGGASCACKTA
jgi:hypothetical protein